MKQCVNRRIRIRGLNKTIAATQDVDTVKLQRQKMLMMEDSLINDQAILGISVDASKEKWLKALV